MWESITGIVNFYGLGALGNACRGYHDCMNQAGMHKRWMPRTQLTPQPAHGLSELSQQNLQTLIEELAPTVRGSHLVAKLLAQRDIQTTDQAKKFLYPKLTDLHDPAWLHDNRKTALRLVQAVHEKQPIVIYCDYDVDGVCAGAILWHVLKLAQADVHIYVPHRIDEGYGLNVQAIQAIAQGQLKIESPALLTENNSPDQPLEPPSPNKAFHGKPLIISVDCGITAMEPAQKARELGVDLIITDHHEFDSNTGLPPAYAIVHPRLKQTSFPQAPEAYPCPYLCGAGVAFKVAWQFAKEFCGSQRVSSLFKDLLLDLLSLAALGTIADIVPLKDENRVITMYGLGHIKRTKNPGLNALIDAGKLRDEKIDAYHVGFVLGPRLNACGRMGHAREAVVLLTTAQGEEASQIAAFLSKQNDQRRAVEKAIFQEAREMVTAQGYDHPQSRAIVLGKKNWHPGVVGIVASRLVDAFHRPVVMLNIAEDGHAHGSARSVAGISIHEAFTHCAQHLETFGGHAMAAGLRLSENNINIFRDALIHFVNSRLPADSLRGLLHLDADCQPQDLDINTFLQIQQLAPFGCGNPAPILCIRNAELIRPALRIGSTGKHLRLTFRLDETTNRRARVCEAVWFGAGEHATQLPGGCRLDIAFSPLVSTWMGRQRIEMHVEDVRILNPNQQVSQELTLSQTVWQAHS